MNILYLHSHDTGRCIQPHGVPVRTPALQHLAEQGCFFRDAHCAAPTCSPSRAALLTGQSAHGAGMVGLCHRGSSLKYPERHLANFLKGHGFLTHKSGLSHVGGPDEAHGYLESARHDHQDGNLVVEDAVAFLKRQNGSVPFFLDAGFLETHRTEWVCQGFNMPHHSPKDGEGNPDYVQVPAILPDSPETRRDWLDFRHSVERLDSFYGRILEALDASGLADDTLVLATTDHGIAFPEHKCSLTHHGSGVLLILRLPGGAGKGRVFDSLVSHLDVYPTLCDLLKVDPPAWLEGRSLLPLIEGKTDTVRDELFTEVTFHAAFEPKRCVRTQRWSYIRNYALPRNTVMPNCDDGHSKRLLMDHGMTDRPVPPEELYDLLFDPMERRNLLGSAECEVRNAECGVWSAEGDVGSEIRNALQDLRTKLDTWMRDTRDPLLEPEPIGIPLPQRVNTWDQLHPGAGSRDWDVSEWPRP
ncbi:MAG: sulfatase [Verrucomicrobia bacterium]|nr:sulfatase [Verrucomicrobiota bacterium]MCH8526186.1 sulfatase [Kiritimatiellia bacterium]